MASDTIRERGRSQRLSRKKIVLVLDGGVIDPVMMAKKAAKKAKAPKEPKEPKVPFDQMPDWWQRLREAVLKRKAETGESLNAMSERAGADETYISNMFTQRKIPQVDYFLRVCDAIEANPAYILWGVDMTPKQARWAKLLEMSNPRIRDALLALAESEQEPEAGPEDPAD